MRIKDMVSIVMPTYNVENYIISSIESVLSQSYENWELIVVDDNSSDNTVNIVKQYALKEHRIRLVTLKKNVGPAIARNVAIELARGRYIAFLDSDDLWLPFKLEKQIAFLNSENIAFSFSSYLLINEEDDLIGKFVARSPITYFDLLKSNSIGCSTVIYDTKKIGKIFMPNTFHEDYVAWLSILKKIGVSKGILEPLAVYRLRRNSKSSNKLKALKAQWSIYRSIERIDRFCSLYYLINYVINGIRKYGLIRFKYT